MYRQFFGLKKKPFSLSADPEFFYFSKGHNLAFTHLEYGLVHNAGFIALTGEVGTGKTSLLRYLLKRIGGALRSAMIFNTQVDPQSLLEMLAKEFEVTPASNRKSDLYDSLYKFFLDQHRKKSRCAIFVDEAQNLTLKAFEELRMLSNLDSGDEPLAQIVLIGQPQLRNRLANASLQQLAQRISVHYHLSALDAEEVGKYMDFRVHAAGFQQGDPLFEKEAVDAIAEASKGIPRVINSISDASLTYAYADRVKTVSKMIVENVLADNELFRLVHRAGENPSPEAVFNGGGHAGRSPAGFDVEGRSEVSDTAALQGVISHLLGRVSALEGQIAEHKEIDSDKAIAILQDMLTGEREKSSRFSTRLAELEQKHREVLQEVEDMRNRKTETRPAETWWRFPGRERR